MTAQATVQRVIDAQQDHDACAYALRSIRACGSEAGCVGPHAGQVARGRRAAARILRGDESQAPAMDHYWIATAKRQAAEALRAAKAARAALGTPRQIRLALAEPTMIDLNPDEDETGDAPVGRCMAALTSPSATETKGVADMATETKPAGGSRQRKQDKKGLEGRIRDGAELSGSEQRAHVEQALAQAREAEGAVDVGLLREARETGLDLTKDEAKRIALDGDYRRLNERFRTHGLPEKDRLRMLELADELGHRKPRGSGGGGDANGKAAKAKAKPAKAKRYPDEIRAAVKVARDARHASGGYPGPKQHVLVREHLDGRDPLEVVGMSERQLRSAAKAPEAGGLATDKFRQLAGLRELGTKFADPFCRGRNLAAILVAVVVERKAAA